MTESSIMQLRVTLKDVKPDTWRRVLVPTSIRYDQLRDHSSFVRLDEQSFA